MLRHLDLDALSDPIGAHAAAKAPVSIPLAIPASDDTSQAAPGSGERAADPAEPLRTVVTGPLAGGPADDRAAAAQVAGRSTTASPLRELPPRAAPTTSETDGSPATAGLSPASTGPAETPLAEQAAAVEDSVETRGEPQPDPVWQEHLVARGDSLARIFDRQGLAPALLHRIVNSSRDAKLLARIRPGQTLRFQFDENRELAVLELQRSPTESLRVAIADDEIRTREISKAVDSRIASAAGMIESSLFADGQKAGLSDGLIMELATIFGWDIDFALEIRAGDQFRVLYEEHFLDGERLRDGPILAAEFTNRGATYRAVRYKDAKGETGYFDADGHSKRRAFIRSPIKFGRVSSRYNPRRWHPILKKWRSHKGVDYAAPTGTPIRATGDGRVAFRGTKGGYGRTVILEHGGKYTTLYAHLSKYSKRARAGNRVKQGQVIGYVGKTGLASGPHLHYEFRVHGKHRDPLRVELPKSLSLPKPEIAAFRKATAPLLAQLEQIPTDTMVASADPGPTRTR
jgi:murein DD-endopeptidase MepM/ murein hydrolase activator NlpD